MGYIVTAVDKATYEQEVDRARQESRKPRWASLDAFLKERIPEEDQVWGSQSMREYGAKGRHDSHGTSAAHDEEHKVNASTKGDTTYPQTLPDDTEHNEAFAQAVADDKASGVRDADVYDANVKLGNALAAGLTAAVAASGTGESDDSEEDTESELDKALSGDK